MACVAFSLIFLGVSVSSINHKEQISTPVTLAVTMTMSFRISSRYKSEVMAWLMSIRALMYLPEISGEVFSMPLQPTGWAFATPWQRFLQYGSPDWDRSLKL